MLWLIRLSGFFSAFLLTLLLSPSLHSFPPAEAIRSSHHHLLLFHPSNPSSAVSTDDPSPPLFTFRTAPSFPISPHCPQPNTTANNNNVCDPSLIHVAITLDHHYLRGSIAAVHSILHHTHCPNTVFFHFLVSDSSSILLSLVHSTFPNLRCKFYHLSPEKVRNLISSSVREALEQPLNYARNYLSEMLEPCVRRVVYLDSDLVVVDDIAKLWKTNLGSAVVGAPEYCHANFTKYYTESFWSEPRFKKTFRGRKPCYFNTGVMVMDLRKWRRGGFTRRIEKWMEVQKKERIYELGSLPPLMLVLAGRVAAIDHRWNQHGLGGDNVKGSCRNLHPGPVSLLHWSGSGKPWVRIDSRRPCPLDALWAPYDLYQPST